MSNRLGETLQRLGIGGHVGVLAAGDTQAGADPDEEFSAGLAAFGGGKRAESLQCGDGRRLGRAEGVDGSCVRQDRGPVDTCGPGAAAPTGDAVVGYGVHQRVAVDGGRAGLPEAAVIEDEDGKGLGELTAILAEESIEQVVLEALQFFGDLKRVEKQRDGDRRVGRKGDAVCVKGDDLRGLTVVEKGKVGGAEPGYGTPRRVGNHDVEAQEAFGRGKGSCRELRAGLVGLGDGSGIGRGELRAGAWEKDESEKNKPAGSRHSFLCVVSRDPDFTAEERPLNYRGGGLVVVRSRWQKVAPVACDGARLG
jgi:hypothetical protein